MVSRVFYSKPRVRKVKLFGLGIKGINRVCLTKSLSKKEVAVDEIIVLTNEFRNKMRRYAQIRQDNNFMFVVAQDILSDVLDVLRATK